MTRRFARAGSRRSTLGPLLGSGAAALLEAAGAKPRGKGKGGHANGRTGGGRKRQKTRVGSEAVNREPPRSSANLRGCNYNNRNLVGADLSSSALTGATFVRANLCAADLSSAQLANADFRGTNLVLADLHSSGCRGVRFNADTTFCRTVDCNGDIRDDDCPGLPDRDVCCASSECNDPAKPICFGNQCVACSARSCPDGCCSNGQCVAGCPTCQVCANGQCVARTCGPCERCNANGQCESTCARCDTCSGGQCAAKTCAACQRCNANTGQCESCSTDGSGTCQCKTLANGGVACVSVTDFYCATPLGCRVDPRIASVCLPAGSISGCEEREVCADPC